MAQAIPGPAGSSTPNTVFTAAHTGLYLFASDVSGIVLAVNDADLGPFLTPTDSGAHRLFLCKLEQGDVVLHYGAACNLSAALLGDIL
jgi:hypothetical protein